jgi:hypothetical protein
MEFAASIFNVEVVSIYRLQYVKTHRSMIRIPQICIQGICKERISAYYLLHVDFLLGLFFYPEDEGDMLLRKSVDFQRTTWSYILAKHNFS